MSETVFWANPGFGNGGESILTLNDRGLTLNSQAMKELKDIQSVKVGVNTDGVIILKPGKGDRYYKICSNIGRNSKLKPSKGNIGSTGLVAYLYGHGAKKGKYKLTHNKSTGDWEAYHFDALN